MLNWRPQREVYSPHVEVFEWILLHKNILYMKISQLTIGTIGSHGNSNNLLEDLITKDNKKVVNEEPRHLFNVNFRVLVHGVGLIDGYLRFYVPLKNFSLIWRRHHCRWRAKLQKLGICSVLGALEKGGTFIGPHLLWHGTSVFAVSSDGPLHSVASYWTHERMWMIYSNLDPHGANGVGVMYNKVYGVGVMYNKVYGVGVMDYKVYTIM
jgi:hypothetical protein